MIIGFRVLVIGYKVGKYTKIQASLIKAFLDIIRRFGAGIEQEVNNT